MLISVLILFWCAGLAAGATLSQLLSLTVWGVMLGGIIALGSIGLTLAYGVLKFPNFAHGALVTLGAYLSLVAVTVLPYGPAMRPLSFGWELLAGFALSMPVTAGIAAVLDWVIYRRLRRKGSSLVLFAMASLGVAFALRSVIYLVWGSDFRFFYNARANPALHLPLGVRVVADDFFILALAMVLVLLIHLLLAHTRMGKAMRATADNADLAQVRGIDTERVITWTWLISGGLAAAGGVMYGLASQLRPEMGFVLLLPMFAAVIMGGIGSPYGALLGAFVVGIAEQLSSAFLNPAYGPGVAFALMVLVLVVHPQGLYGSAGTQA